ncbi:ATP-binding protein [Alphaproteobacteria bacterium]|nr:ATP-binding protein [Alphaproteobacteria bacterium]
MHHAQNRLIAGNYQKLPKITLTLSRNSDDEVWLNVIDNGPGISKDNFSQILQSGFSTKAGHNRGHGLPAAAMLANSWGGYWKWLTLSIKMALISE